MPVTFEDKLAEFDREADRRTRVRDLVQPVGPRSSLAQVNGRISAVEQYLLDLYRFRDRARRQGVETAGPEPDYLATLKRVAEAV